MSPPFFPEILAEEPLDVVAVGAHPDDVEIACGGTLARLAELGYRVGIIDLTDGEPTPGSPGPEVRLKEAAMAARELGVSIRETLDLPNRHLIDSIESRTTLAKVLRRWRPRIVLGFGEKTPHASPDHWQAMQITEAAIFYSRLTKWDERFDGLPPHRIDQLLYYRIALEHQFPLPGTSEFVMDIGTQLERKLRAIACYATQFPDSKRHVFERVRAAALQAGHRAGFAAGEVFASPRTLGVTDFARSDGVFRF
ncbi:MAG TPA: PIG-L family deacetylase [Pirellulaceae bacterium]